MNCRRLLEECKTENEMRALEDRGGIIGLSRGRRRSGRGGGHGAKAEGTPASARNHSPRTETRRPAGHLCPSSLGRLKLSSCFRLAKRPPNYSPSRLRPDTLLCLAAGDEGLRAAGRADWARKRGQLWQRSSVSINGAEGRTLRGCRSRARLREERRTGQ